MKKTMMAIILAHRSGHTIAQQMQCKPRGLTVYPLMLPTPSKVYFLFYFFDAFLSINSDLQRGLDRRLRHTQH